MSQPHAYLGVFGWCSVRRDTFTAHRQGDDGIEWGIYLDLYMGVAGMNMDHGPDGICRNNAILCVDIIDGLDGGKQVDVHGNLRV